MNFKNQITFDPNLFRPTSTIGYQVELVHTEDTKSQEPQSPTPPNEKPTIEAPKVEQADVKIKQTTPSKAIAKKQVTPKPEKQKAQIVETKKVKAQKEKAKTPTQINTADHNQDGVIMTDKNQDNIVSSAPKAQDNNQQVGDGGTVNSSTNGMGTQSGTFDFRVIQYGRDAADAIKQNIVVPPNLANQYFTYRAFIRLNKNMEYESMVLVKSTGNAQLDKNIAKALRQTIYPPLPPGANFDQYKNIDFTVK